MNGTRRHWAALPVVAAGLTWAGWAAVAAAAGTVADGVALWLVATSGLLLAVGLAGVVLAFDWAYQFPGGEGAALAAVGALSFAVGQALRLVRGEGGLTTSFLAPGVLALVAGSLLLAAGLVRARRLPPWIGVSLFVGTVLFLGFNRVPALALPVGLAWVAVGSHLWRHPDRPADHLEPSAVGR
ncbi:hypothetical protein SAMN05216559_2522 [Halomicrobium zhouii]|uniref:Uncharacterized protein n=1 Tax=Halomicrobium zhouii TaxID=767519 RepID=A0A1I6LDQ4_9EURY|nr:hypothetical protein [Halomicrobium zhouii]SFS01631.1 hypothetical protein SAMN05216559_2522 [Halomicrobium zhouii]